MKELNKAQKEKHLSQGDIARKWPSQNWNSDYAAPSAAVLLFL